MNDTTFTLTLIKDGETSRILVSSSNIPAKADEDADAVISQKTLPATYKTIVDTIPNFRDAEDGCEDWITHSVDEFLDIYDLDLVKVFEDAEEDLEAVDDEAFDELSEKDQSGENTTADEVKDPEYDSDLFGASDEMTEPGEIFLVAFKPNQLTSAMSKLQFK